MARAWTLKVETIPFPAAGNDDDGVDLLARGRGQDSAAEGASKGETNLQRPTSALRPHLCRERPSTIFGACSGRDRTVAGNTPDGGR